MKYSLMVTLLISTLVGAPAYAQCEKGSSTLFSCSMQKSGKVVEVCDATDTIQYYFGKARKKPELALSVPRDEVTTSQWQGVGRYESYSVDIPNADTIYRVYWSHDRLNEDQDNAVEAGVEVETNGKSVANLLCKPASVVSNLQGVDLAEQ